VNWTALVPLKTAAMRKSRLAARLGPDARIALSRALLGRLMDALHTVPRVTSIVLVADEAGHSPAVRWIEDEGGSTRNWKRRAKAKRRLDRLVVEAREGCERRGEGPGEGRADVALAGP
jgi:2-phospho-L-lactate guanylyltransferase (CobY/MobA/RfbA family)